MDKKMVREHFIILLESALKVNGKMGKDKDLGKLLIKKD
jgi:hypothetical protein